ncbi:MAG: serine hydrolase, partial [Gemmatimonadaceae bacterium]|nr:serine hydrolase [Gemmatimonadaceae bacterium]
MRFPVLVLSLGLQSVAAMTLDAQQCAIVREYWPTAGWKAASPAAEGADSALLDSALTRFGAAPSTVYAVVVTRHGYIVAERYYHDKDSTERFDLRSATKSVVSMLTGIAIDRKLLRGIDQDISAFVPEYFTADSVDPRKTRITLRHLLTMTSGLRWVEGHGAEYLNGAPNWPVAILSQPMTAEPGRLFNYSSGNAHLLSTAIARATHRSTLEFANEALFGPLGFTLPLLDWSTDVRSINSGGAGLRLRAREMAKLGYLYLNRGCWDGKQIVSEKWVAQSTKKWSDPGPNAAGYGFLW